MTTDTSVKSPSIQNTISEATRGEAITSNSETAVSNNDVSEQSTSHSDTSISDWRTLLPEELRNTPSLSRFKDLGSFTKSFLEGEKALSSRIALPKDDAPDEEWEKFYKTLGRPEDKKYLPDEMRGEEDEATLSRYEEILHKSGLTHRQGKHLLNEMMAMSKTMAEEGEKAREGQRASNLLALEKAFGDQMDIKLKHVQAALGQYGGAELATFVENSDYNPALIQFLSQVGSTLVSDTLVTGDTKAALSTKESAMAEINRLEVDENFQAQYRSSDPEHRAKAQEKMAALYEVAYQNSAK